MDTQPTYQVGELTAYIKHRLERDPALQQLRVAGEVSNLTYHGSGHVYFSLKDAQAQISCVMFRSQAQSAPRMAAGDKVTLIGDINVYPPRGSYQLVVQKVEKQGLGDLYQQFLELKARLQKEGLFDPAHKKALPPFPRKVAVITSPTGAAIRDILRTLQRRFPPVQIVVIPAVVQGVQGKDSLVQALDEAQRSEAEVIILARGGGSLEDLWNFNEEAVARAIRASQLPIISGVGHESDVTIADFAADLRASTPTAAAEHAVPDQSALLQQLSAFEQQLQRGLQHYIDFKRQVLDDYTHRLQQLTLSFLGQQRHQVEILATQLAGLDMTQLLERGYTLSLKAGKLQTSSQDLQAGDEIETIFADGRVSSTVQTKKDFERPASPTDSAL
ncbi:MAG: exodeoxyribonuclease VII large subunit [Bacteroidota bacterium]